MPIRAQTRPMFNLDGPLMTRTAGEVADGLRVHGFTTERYLREVTVPQVDALAAVAEAYPDLKANQNFLSLQAELSDIENKLAAARRFFNNAVSEFNAAIQQFPAVLFAGMFGFKEREFFDLGEQRAALEQAPPQVKF